MFFKITCSLLKLAQYTTNGGETQYACVLNRFHDNHQKIASGNITSSLLKLAQYGTHGGETWYACVFNRFHDNRPPTKITSGNVLSKLLLHSSNLLSIAHMEVKLGTHVYRIVSMTTTNKNSLRYLIVSMTTMYINEWRQVNKNILWITKRRAYRDGIKRKGDKIGMEYEA